MVIKKDKTRGNEKFNIRWFFLIAALVSITAIIYLRFLRSHSECKRLKFWGVEPWIQWNPRGSLTTVKKYFRKLNFEFVNASYGDDWDIGWLHESPFISFQPTRYFAGLERKPLKKHQKLNHFPGIGFLVIKSSMAYKNQGSKYILPSFQVPQDLEKLRAFMKNNPKKKILEKDVNNRGINIVKAKDVKTEKHYNVYYQQFMDKPYLLDGHAFDFGVYALITSYDPLRIYRFRDAYFRFCEEEYYPFDVKNKNKYVVDGPGKPVYEMPTFKDLNEKYQFSFTQIFEYLIEGKGFNVQEFWSRINDAVVEIVMNSEEYVLHMIAQRNLSTRNFFELVRFDIILDEELNPYVMEVNMSPNLTPGVTRKFGYAKLFEQVAYNTIKMIGGSSYYEFMSRLNYSDVAVSYEKDLAVNMKQCLENDCVNSCSNSACETCLPCVSEDDLYQIREAFREHLNLGNFIRLFPSSVYYNNTKLIESMTKNNQFSINWFKGKCEIDKSWC